MSELTSMMNIGKEMARKLASGFEEKQKEAAGNAISTYRLFNGQGSTTNP